jgi:hypothetical protein
MQPIKKGRSVHRIRFHVYKVDERRCIEDAMQTGKQLNGGSKKAVTRNHLPELQLDSIHSTTSDFERAKAAAPGWDIYVPRAWMAELDRQ